MAKDKTSTRDADRDARAAAAEAVEAVRAAVERTFVATAESAQLTRDRAQELVDEIGAAAQRVRGALDGLDLVEEVRGMRSELESLARRIDALESRPTGSGDGDGAAPEAAPARKAKSAAGPGKAAKPKAAGGAAKAKPATTRGTATAGRPKATRAKKGARGGATTPADDAGEGRS
jgi:TolA-binding protein